jgi:DUF4097 and DUF4098 domain-containing protein YvlB
MKTTLIVLLTLGLAFSGALAQIQVDKRLPATPRGEVNIENSFGTVKVIGWDKNEVAVTGHLAPGAEGLDFEGDKEGIWIDVDVPESWFYDSDDDTEYRSHLEVHVPKGSILDIETLNAGITITGVNGAMEIESVNGSVLASGNPPAVDIESMTGSVEVNASSAVMDVETISGSVVLRGARKNVAVSTLSGAIKVIGRDLEDVELESTAGEVSLEGSLTKEGSVEIETFSGQVELVLDRGVEARFDLTTFGGTIQSEIGPRPRRDGKFNPFQELRFATGLNECEITVETFSGSITVRLKEEAGRTSQ